MFNKISIRTETKLSKEEIYNYIDKLEKIMKTYFLLDELKYKPDIHFIKFKSYKKGELFGYYRDKTDKIYINRDINVNFIEESIIHEYIHHLYKYLYRKLPDNFLHMKQIIIKIYHEVYESQYMKDYMKKHKTEKYFRSVEEVIVRTLTELVLNERLYLTEDEFLKVKQYCIDLINLMNDNIEDNYYLNKNKM